MTQVTRFAWPIPVMGDELGFSRDEDPDADSATPTDWAASSNLGFIWVGNTTTVIIPASDHNLTATLSDGGGSAPTSFGSDPAFPPSFANDNNGTTYAARPAYFGGAATTILRSDLGSAKTVATMVVIGGIGNNGEFEPGWTVERSSDNVVWTSTAITSVWSSGSKTTDITITTPVSARYWRIIASTGSGFNLPILVYTWSISGSSSVAGEVLWTPGPAVNDGDDASYNFSTGSNALRADLNVARTIGRAELRVAESSNGARTYTLYGTNDPTWANRTVLGSVSFTALGSFQAQEVAWAWSNSTPYEFYEMDGDYHARRFHDLNLYEPLSGFSALSSNSLALGGVVVGNAASSNYHFVATSPTTGLWLPHDTDASETPIEHGNMGSTETIDVGQGTWHRGTLNANCAITVTGFAVDSGVAALVGIAQDGTGGWDITWDADVDFGSGDDQPDQTASSITWFMLWTDDGNASIFGAKVGGGGASLGSIVAHETTFGITPFAGSSNTAARSDHTHGSPSVATISGHGFVAEILISDTPSTPLVFADLLQNEAQDDLIYGDPSP